MTWWRKNWVDVLMIGLILSVVGGFVALLLRGTPTSLAEDPNTVPVTAPPPAASAPSPAPPASGTPGTDTTTSGVAPSSPVTPDSSVPTAPSEPDVSVTPSPPPSPPAAVSTTKPDTSTSSASGTNAMTGKPAGTTTSSEADATIASSKPAGSVASSGAQKPSGSSTGTTSAQKPASTAKPATTASSKPGANDVPQLDSNAGNTGADVMAARTPKPAPRQTTITEIPAFTAPKPSTQTAPKPRSVTVERPAPRPEPRVSSTPRSVYLRSYRVAVGSFGSPSGAASLAAKLRAQGFKARALASGKVTIVVLGPYPSEAAAQTAFNKVRAQYPDAILYRPNGTKLRAPVTAKAAPTENKPATETANVVSSDTTPIAAAEAAQQASEDTAPAGPAFLQVGAFKNVSSAQPLMRKLEGLGYQTTLRTSADGYTRVLVGPLEGSSLERARSKLRARGFRPFAVAQ